MNVKDNQIKFIPGIEYIVNFHDHLLTHNRILKKLNSTYYDESELNSLQEAVLIRQMTAWEEFLSNIIPYCISLDTINLSNFIGVDLPKIITTENAKAIFNGINYTNISNTSDLISLTENIISTEHNPFQQFMPPMLKYIDEAYFLRNYIAHQSHISKSKVQSFYYINYGIDKFIEPGEYLRNKRNFEIGDTTPAEMYYFILMQITVFCWRFLDRDSYNKVYANNNPKEEVGLGYFNMSKVFEELSEKIRKNGRK